MLDRKQTGKRFVNFIFVQFDNKKNADMLKCQCKFDENTTCHNFKIMKC